MKTTRIIVAALTALSLGACASQDLKLRGGLAGGFSTVKATLEGVSDRTDGEDLGGRIEIAREVDGFDNTEAGLRIGGFFGELDYVGDTLDTTTVEIHGVVRQYLVDDGATVRPYAEVFAGYGHHFWDLSEESGDGGGFSGGGGLGIEAGPVFLQVDYTYSAADLDGLDVDGQNLRAFLGGKVSF